MNQNKSKTRVEITKSPYGGIRTGTIGELDEEFNDGAISVKVVETHTLVGGGSGTRTGIFYFTKHEAKIIKD